MTFQNWFWYADFLLNKTFLIIINVKKVVLCNIFVEIGSVFKDSFINIMFKITAVEIETFCNILNIFTVTVDQFSVSLLNKSIHFFIFSPLSSSLNTE